MDAQPTSDVLARRPPFEPIRRLNFKEQIIRYGADSPQGVRRMRAALDVLGDLA